MPFFAVRKKFPFSQTKSFLFTESLRTALKSCPFTYKSSSFAQAFPCWFQKPPIFTNQKLFFYTKLSLFPPKTFFFARRPFQPPLTYCLQKIPFFTNQKPFFCTNLSFLLSQAILFHPPPPLSTSLNLLFAKNTAVLLISALILCCKAGTSHRFKSLPAIPGEVAAFRKTGYLINAGRFRNNHVSTGDLNRPRSPEVRKPLACFLVLFARRKKNVKTSLSQGAPRFCKPRSSPLQLQLRTATIKTFLREHRGFANLEPAHRNGSFAPQQLKPFSGASRFCKPQSSAHSRQLRAIQSN